MAKTIVITGVTGTQGLSVARTFLDLPGWNVRGISRNPSNSVAQELVSKGASVVRGDLDDVESLKSAFGGATAVFANTDFFGHFFAAIGAPDLAGGRSAAQYACEREVEQGVNIAKAVEAAALPTLQNFIYSTLADASKWSSGKYDKSYHNNSKAETIRHIRQHYPEIARRMSLMIVGQYVENWKINPALAPRKQPDGSFLVQSCSMLEYEVPFIIARRDVGPFVQALTELPPGQSILASSEHMTWPAWAKLWGEVMNVKTIFQHVSEDEYFKGFPPAFRDEFTETHHFHDEFGFTGGDPELMIFEQGNELGSKVQPTSMKDYIRTEDWSSIL